MNRTIISAVVILALAAGGAIWLMQRSQAPSEAIDAAVAPNAVDQNIDTSSIVEMTMGSDDSPVTIVEYASFTCPHCARFHEEQFKQLKADYIDTGKVHFIYRDVYFDRFGLWAAMIARCAGPERFFGISDILYAEQSDWIGSGQDPVEVSNNLRRIGRVAGLDEAQLEACLSDADKARTLTAWYQKNAEADDVNSTPTLIINGQKHSNMSYSQLKELLDGLLQG
ncbi:MAG: DsbA family protein [Pseudomonadota bacterium]